VQASLITGVLGIQAMPTVVEVVGWLVYLVPVGLYIGWAPGRPVPWRAVSWASLVAAAGSAAAAISFAVAAPSSASAAPETWTTPVAGSVAPVVWTTTGAKAIGHDVRGGVDVDVLTRQRSRAVTGAGLLASVTADQLRQLNGGRLPIGVTAADVTGRVALSYGETVTDTLYVDGRTDRLLDASRRVTVTATAKLSSGPLVLENVRDTTQQPTAAARGDLAVADHHALSTQARSRSWGSDYPALLGIAAAVLAALSAGSRIALRRSRPQPSATASMAESAEQPAAREAARQSDRDRLPTG
jgi:high-affinity iron transporter